MHAHPWVRSGPHRAGVQATATQERQAHDRDARSVATLAPVRVNDPERRGWWDPTLTPEEVQARIAGLERTLDYMAAIPDTPRAWLVEERGVLAGLKRRAAHQAARPERSRAQARKRYATRSPEWKAQKAAYLRAWRARKKAEEAGNE